MASASAEFALAFHLSPGNNHDAPEGRTLIRNIVSHDKHPLLMDRAYEDEATRQATLDRNKDSFRDKNAQSDIVKILHIDKSYLIRIIRHLCTKGIVEKTKSNDDKRTTILTLTTAGNKETNR